jgi:hypothetical protein
MSGEEAEEALDSVQALVPSRWSVLAFSFQVIEEVEDDLIINALHGQLIDRDTEVLTAERDEQVDAVTVAGDGVLAGPLLVAQIRAKEVHHERSERSAHSFSPELWSLPGIAEGPGGLVEGRATRLL